MELFCPHCDYNLAGLPGNRCPECGRDFDRENLEVVAKEAVPPIHPGWLAFRLAWPPLATVAASAVASLFDSLLDTPIGLFIAILSAPAIATGCIVNCFSLPARIVALARRLRGSSRQARNDAAELVLLFLLICWHTGLMMVALSLAGWLFQDWFLNWD